MALLITKIPQNIKLFLISQGSSNYLFVFGWLGYIKYKFKKVINMDVKYNLLKLSSNKKFLFNTYFNLITSFYFKTNNTEQKKIQLNGVGYKFRLLKNTMYAILGYSHLISLCLCNNIAIKLIKNKTIELTSLDSHLLNYYVYKIKAFKKFDVYKGKGFIVSGEINIRKEGKKATF
jgi:large subunit ribosomal protein L6